ncbi:MAG: hypothetical protein GY820_35965 [Gammaproteobacteria bacterium]|nr:hypothetical protein [Gammaproteobacteria bacterium]
MFWGVICALHCTHCQDARPMIDQLQYDEKYEAVMRHIFGRVLIVKTMDVGTELAKKERLDCVTLEGTVQSTFETLSTQEHFCQLDCEIIMIQCLSF